jgi:tetratricopeptide (TPR) repeat protein
VQQLESNLRSIGIGERVSTTMIDRRTTEQLRSLGYLGGVSQQQYELTGKGVDPKDRIEVIRLLELAVGPESHRGPQERITFLRRALALDPTNPTIYYDLGETYAKTGRDADALKLYHYGIEKGIRTGWIYSRLANLQMRRGQQAEAITSFEKAAQLNPSDTESLSDLGLAYLDTGRLADAERAFKWAVATGKDYAPAHNGLGLVAIQKNDLPAARDHFKRAVELDPGLLEAQLNLGRIYKMTGANARARECFEAFLARASPAEYGDVIPRIKAELAAMP